MAKMNQQAGMLVVKNGHFYRYLCSAVKIEKDNDSSIGGGAGTRGNLSAAAKN